MTPSAPGPLQRAASRVLLACLATSLALQPRLAAAAPTDLSDVPLVVQTGVKPNILFTLDNSGSMAWGSITGSDAEAEYTRGDKDQRAYYSPSYNRIYYNPAITYTPGVRWDAAAPGYTTSMGDMPPTGANTDPYLGGRTVDVTEHCWDRSSPPDLPRYDAEDFRANFNCRTTPGSFDTTEYARYAFYYVWKGSGTEDGSSGQDSDANYDIVEILPATATYPKAATRTDCGSGATCSYAQEIQNFANWFSYYRTRLLTAKSSLGQAFSVLDDRSRVGFATINSNASNFIALADFDSNQKQSWFARLHGIHASGGTPLIRALDRAGRYFEHGTFPGTPSTPRTTTVPLRCTPNYTILSTDGYWTDNDGADVGDTDHRVPGLPADVYTDAQSGARVNDPVAGVPLNAGEPFPAPFYDGEGARNTLADVAMHYWIRDLTGNSAGRVLANAADPATWQHMVTYTIGLGASGTLSAPPPPGQSWPRPREGEPTTIDDLWHAALNGHGSYFNSSDPARLKSALGEILSDIVNRSSAASGVAVSNPNVTSGDNVAFSTSFSSGAWFGDLQASEIDLATGAFSSTPLWSAQPLLDAKPAASRLVASYDGSAGVPFTPTGLGALASRLDSPTAPPGPGDHPALIAWLRGDRSLEGDGSDATRPYRKRQHVLGDLVNAEPNYVSAPRANYTDDGYLAFKGSTASRPKVVYQAGNDGMLHAFDAGTGEELWGYVPGALLQQPLSSATPGTSVLAGLAAQEGFAHRFLVDGTPTTTDIDLSNTVANRPSPPAPQWATMLVGGLGKGGRGYYALNVTDPRATTDAEVAAKVMWEFPNATTTATVRSRIGYSYGNPVMVKTRAAGWVVLVSSGYNNGADTGGDGRGRLFVLDAATGNVIRQLSTGVGSSATPSGLGRISAYLRSPGVDDTADYAYGGDLQGNVWRFDLSGASSADWNVRRLATLVDPNGQPQPVTTSPELGVINGKRMVYVGTGKYLGVSDIPGTPGANANADQRQTFYGLLDDESDNPAIPTPLRGQLVRQQGVRAGSAINLTSNPVELATKRGWFLDLTAGGTGERSTTSPVLFQGVLTFTTNTPSSDPCVPGGSSNLYFVDYSTGGAIPNLVSRFVGNVMSSRPQPLGLPDGSVKIVVRTSDGATRVFDVALPNTTRPARVMWREVVRQ